MVFSRFQNGLFISWSTKKAFVFGHQDILHLRSFIVFDWWTLIAFPWNSHWCHYHFPFSTFVCFCFFLRWFSLFFFSLTKIYTRRHLSNKRRQIKCHRLRTTTTTTTHQIDMLKHHATVSKNLAIKFSVLTKDILANKWIMLALNENRWP